MKKTLIIIIITFVVTSLLWVASLFIWYFPRINELEEALLLEKVKRKEVGSAIKREAESSSKRTQQYDKDYKRIKEKLDEIKETASKDMEYEGYRAPSTDFSEKELCLTVNVYDSTGTGFRIGTINPRGTLLDLEADGQFVLTNSDNQQYKYMTTEHLRGRGKLYVIKLK